MSGGTLDLTNSAAIQNSTLTMTGSGTLLFDSSVSANAFTLGGLQSGSSGPGYDIALQNSAGAPLR